MCTWQCRRNTERKDLKNLSTSATAEYRRFYELATAEGTTSERFEHCTRALTDVLGNIIMGYLLLLDSFRNASFLASCRYFVKESLGQAVRHTAAIEAL